MSYPSFEDHPIPEIDPNDRRHSAMPPRPGQDPYGPEDFPPDGTQKPKNMEEPLFYSEVLAERIRRGEIGIRDLNGIQISTLAAINPSIIETAWRNKNAS